MNKGSICLTTEDSPDAFSFALFGFKLRCEIQLFKGRTNMSLRTTILLIVLVMLVATIPGLPFGRSFNLGHKYKVGFAMLVLFSLHFADGI